MAARVEGSAELIGHALVHGSSGALGGLYVRPDQRRRGLARQLVLALASRVHPRPVFAYIELGNTASMSLFTDRLGFRVTPGRYYWLELTPETELGGLDSPQSGRAWLRGCLMPS